MSEKQEQIPQQPAPSFSEDFFSDDRQNILERLAQARASSAGAPSPAEPELARCPRCGSTWFAELNFQQYKANVYSYGPGGDLQVASVTSVPIRVCICGFPLPPDVTTQGINRGALARTLESFGESMARAQKFLEDSRAKIENSIQIEELKARDNVLAEMKNFIDSLKKAAEEKRRQAGEKHKE